MNVRDMVRDYLQKNGYDGLYNPDIECCCDTDDLMPCDFDCVIDCMPGYKTECDPETCPWGGDCGFHISSERGHNDKD